VPVSKGDQDNDYSLKDIEVDARFVVAAREMYITYAFQILFTVVIIGIAFIFGGKSLAAYRFIFGMPSWWFGTVVASLGFLILLVFLSSRIFKDISIEPYVTDEDICEEGGKIS
jgi:uncharacterized membrane protein YhdT